MIDDAAHRQRKEKQPTLSYDHSEFEHVTVRNLVFARLQLIDIPIRCDV
jgi:hypothetical protein